MNISFSSRLKVLIVLAAGVFALAAGSILPVQSQETEAVDQQAVPQVSMDQDPIVQDAMDQDSDDQASDGQQKLAAISAPDSDQSEAAQAVAGLPARSPHDGISMDLFGRKSWYTPPPAAPVREVRTYQAPAPTAPPLPFSVMGSYEAEGEDTLYFLVKGDRVFDVRVGDVLEGTYRVDGPSNGQLKFTYLPLDISQGIQLGEGQ